MSLPCDFLDANMWKNRGARWKKHIKVHTYWLAMYIKRTWREEKIPKHWSYRKNPICELWICKYGCLNWFHNISWRLMRCTGSKSNAQQHRISDIYAYWRYNAVIWSNHKHWVQWLYYLFCVWRTIYTYLMKDRKKCFYLTHWHNFQVMWMVFRADASYSHFEISDLVSE